MNLVQWDRLSEKQRLKALKLAGYSEQDAGRFFMEEWDKLPYFTQRLLEDSGELVK